MNLKKYFEFENYFLYFENKLNKLKGLVGFYFSKNIYIKECMIELEISNICNALCIFCPWIVIKNTNKKFQMMSEETFNKVLDKISKQSYRIISFTPTTGELLVHKNWNFYIKKASKLKNIDKIIFYSNGILLDENNRRKLLELLLEKESKLKEIHFSIGGIDKDTYKLMYGVNQFEKVKSNIKELLIMLKENNLKVRVQIEIREPKYQSLTKQEIRSVFNEINYRYLKIRILKVFARIECIPKREELLYLNKEVDRKKPCKHLYKTRYDVNGNIWADGCVVSELPNDFELKLGSLEDDLSIIEERRKKIINNWKEGKLPKTCKKCDMYTWY